MTDLRSLPRGRGQHVATAAALVLMMAMLASCRSGSDPVGAEPVTPDGLVSEQAVPTEQPAPVEPTTLQPTPEPLTESDTTTEPENESLPEPAAFSTTFLLPASEEWAVVEYYVPEDNPPGERTVPGVWVWRVDGKLVILQVGPRVAFDDALGPAQAEIRTEANRAVIGWRSGDVGVGLVAIDMTEDALRAAVDRLVEADDGWMLPGGELVLHEPTGIESDSANEQLNFAPISDDGVPNLGTTVITSRRVASPGAMYRELSSASSLGITTERTIAGEPAFQVTGQGQIAGSWVGVAIDGTVVTWSTTSSGLADDDQLTSLLDSLRLVDANAWQQAIAARDEHVAQAVLAVELDPLGLPVPVDLPRFVLPSGWSPEWVTDKGIWTPQERADEIAQSLARRPNDIAARWPVATRVQGFVFDDGTRTEVFVPDLIMSTALFDDGRGVPVQPSNYVPISAGGLEGSTFGGSVELYGDNVRVFIQGQGLPEAELLAVVDAIQPRLDDFTAGFDIEDARFREVFDDDRYQGSDDFL